MRKVTFGLLSILGMATFLPTAGVAMSLEDALVAAENNPQLLQAYAQQQAVSAEVQSAKGALLPNITLSAAAQVDQQKGAQFSTDGDSLTGTLSLSQPLFQKGLLSALKTAEARSDGAIWEVSAAEDNLMVQTVGAYADALAAQKSLAQAQQLLETLNQRAQATSKGFTAGRYTRTDVAQAESRAATAQAQVANSQQVFESALASLENFTGKTISRTAIHWPNNRTDQWLFTDLEVLQEAVAKNNPTLLAGEKEVASLSHAVAIREGGVWPRLTLNASHTRTEDDSSFTAEEDSRASLNLNWSLFTGGQVQADVASAQAQLTAGEARLENNKRLAKQQATSAFYGLRAAKKAVMAQQEAVLAAELAAEGARKEVQHGRRTILDVLDTEQELADAHTALAQAKASVLKATYQVLALLGEI